MSTIVALATPGGVSALHVIRMSGNDAFRIINKLSVDSVEKTKDRLQITFIKSRNGQLIDQVVISKFYAPNSYTGEDCIEISCHGNVLISKLIIDELIKEGARYAERGEFTKRAYLNNKIDLNQAMNIGLLFNAKNEVDIYSSVSEIRGMSSKIIKNHLNEIMNLISECELNIDYPPDIEKDEINTVENLKTKIKKIYLSLSFFLQKSKKQKFSNYRVVFVGKPNAGKSSLVNYLIDQDKIIVSDKAGTTRDAIEVDFCFEGYLLTLIDTAGVSESKDFLIYDYTDKSIKEIKSADLIIYLISCQDVLENNKVIFEKNKEFWEKNLKNKKFIQIFSKSDLLSAHEFENKKILKNSISVFNKDVEFLYKKLREHLQDFYTTTGLKFSENINNLNNACIELEKIENKNILYVDLIVEHLHIAYDYLSSILGINKNKTDKINHIFDNFCVGK